MEKETTLAIYAVVYSCHEDHGVYRHCSDKGEADKLCAEKRADVGQWTAMGDQIQSVYVSEITVDGPVFDPLEFIGLEE